MKYPQLLATLTEEPLLITPSAHASLLKLFNDHATLTAEQFKAAREDIEFCGEKFEVDKPYAADGIMFIPVAGPLGRGLGKFEKMAGAIDVADIADELSQFEADPNLHTAVMIFDSPGGMYSGTPELGERIRRVEKPKYAFVPGMAASAAYWLASSTDAIYATTSADVGSIGVYAYLLDTSERYKAMGVKPELIASGKYKGAGAPGIPLTDDQRANLQERVNEMAESFYGHVETMRGKGNVSRQDMQGQTFKASTAMAKGLIDGVVSDMGEFLGQLGY